MMLAKLFPWSIVYPTLVDLNTDEGCQLEELHRIFDCLVIELSSQLLLVLTLCIIVVHLPTLVNGQVCSIFQISNIFTLNAV